MVFKLKIQLILPQYHVIYDGRFETVTSTERRWKLDLVDRVAGKLILWLVSE